MYKVLKFFIDLQDNKYKYNIGDVYPRVGYTPSIERIQELASDKNKRKMALIEEISENVTEISENTEEKPKPKRRTKKTYNKE